MFSLDGVGEQFEYIRSGAAWEEVWENFNYFKSQKFLRIQICHTVSIFNVYYLKDFVTAFSDTDIYFNLLHYPRQYCIRNMPDVCKDKAKDKIINIAGADSIINFMMQDAEHDRLDTGFFSVTEKLDDIRNEKFQDIFPEFYEILIDGGLRNRPWHNFLITTENS
jgi:hypothetical protein